MRVRVDRAGNRVHPTLVAAAAGLLLAGSALAGDAEDELFTENEEERAFMTVEGDYDGWDGPYTAELTATASGLDEPAARAVVVAAAGPLRRLLEPLAGDGGVATLTLTIGPDGRVTHARVTPDHDRARAVRAPWIRRLRFAPSDGGGTVVARYGPPALE